MLILRGGGEGGVVRELFMLTLCGGGRVLGEWFTYTLFWMVNLWLQFFLRFPVPFCKL